MVLFFVQVCVSEGPNVAHKKFLMTNVVGLICLAPEAIFAPATQFKGTAASPFVASGSRSDLVNSAMYPKNAFVLQG